MKSFWLCYLLLSTQYLLQTSSLSFNFDFSQPGHIQNINFLGDASFNTSNPLIELTKSNRSAGLDNSIGRASYAQPVTIWNDVTGEVATFTTTFSFRIETKNINNGNNGDGMAFFLGHYPSSIPSASAGANLALFSTGATSTGATGDNRVVAVEFDTYMNAEYMDNSNNHIGIDVNSLISKNSTDTNVPGKNLTSGLLMTCRIAYDSSKELLAADLQIGDTSYHVEASADLRQLLPSQVAIGFSGATGIAQELHRVLSWSFNSTLVRSPTPAPENGHGSRNFMSKVPWRIVGPIIGVLTVVAALFVCLRKPWTRKKPASSQERDERQEPILKDSPANVPRPFSYRELAKATNNFAAQSKLGEGGYAVVYKGQLKNPNRLVAIKNFKLVRQSATERRKAFEDEIKVIIKVRQRHLVELVGWCIDEEKDIVSLVYELVSEGSLHEHLHKGRSWLSWPSRHQIILDLGCALRYLHGECTECILHGDISASNILLDEKHGTKLADFGLARLMDHAMELKTTCNLAGTPGYIDPDFVNIGKRSRESDVYGFGIVLLETVTGRSPAAAAAAAAGDLVSPLLKWAWGIQRSSTILDAADPRLRDECTSDQQDQMERVLQVALWCAHTEPTQRPSINEAMRALESRDVAIPRLPPPGFVARPSNLVLDDMSCETSDSVISPASSRA
ncbi:L-type lectin-domain containing receptor kinase IX.1-like [Panicum virgatum]|nr:L-type lectin-domain containing receptor kinase IX.1-like [Panicum virgatum]